MHMDLLWSLSSRARKCKTNSLYFMLLICLFPFFF